VIVDSPLTLSLTVGQDRRIPDQLDARIEVPPVIIPIVLALQPTKVLENTSTPQQQSFFTESIFTRTNQPTTAQTIGTLAKGLWELEITLSSWFNYNNTPGALNRVQIDYFMSNLIVPSINRFAGPGSYTDYQRVRILVEQQCAILHRVPATAVGENLSTVATLNAIRII
jgi:hypothetical protein